MRQTNIKCQSQSATMFDELIEVFVGLGRDILDDGVVLFPNDSILNISIKMAALGSLPSITHILRGMVHHQFLHAEPDATKTHKIWFFDGLLWRHVDMDYAVTKLLTDPRGAFQGWVEVVRARYASSNKLTHAKEVVKEIKFTLGHIPDIIKDKYRFALAFQHEKYNIDTFAITHANASTNSILFANGIVMELPGLKARRVNAGDCFTHSLPVSYVVDDFYCGVDGKVHKLKDLIRSILGKSSDREYHLLLRFLATCLTAKSRTSESALFLVGNDQTSGKRLLLRLIQRALGSRIVSVPGERLVSQINPPSDAPVKELVTEALDAGATCILGEGLKSSSQFLIKTTHIPALASITPIQLDHRAMVDVLFDMGRIKTIVSVDSWPSTFRLVGDEICAKESIVVNLAENITVDPTTMASVENGGFNQAVIALLVYYIAPGREMPAWISED
ncbi:uncharacterized protein BJ171DRAFT_27593 [Polychytrium aggregatum]|uniref:uncharacterized protein n=1 Tax=Polychytrium aggregatum TaxID=110093 RepID=UPI0022FE3800|nr:uncharacterized protein BJ171DRAFT_27593 [Polychytrium aggregatum]KAI9206261.1 hypothetical protein BJ171DRAFT_27593 [Polychytrium aggregatum]